MLVVLFDAVVVDGFGSLVGRAVTPVFFAGDGAVVVGFDGDAVVDFDVRVVGLGAGDVGMDLCERVGGGVNDVGVDFDVRVVSLGTGDVGVDFDVFVGGGDSDGVDFDVRVGDNDGRMSFDDMVDVVLGDNNFVVLLDGIADGGILVGVVLGVVG